MAGQCRRLRFDVTGGRMVSYSFDRGRWARMIVAFAGNRIDTAERVPPRFPPSNESWVGQRLERLLAALAPSLVVGAAAPGTDILTLEAAARLGIASRMVLPLPPDDFRRSSVADCGNGWVDRYDRLLENMSAESVVWGDHGHPDDLQLFQHGNAAILDAAMPGTPEEEVVAVVVRPKDPGRPPSITDDFVARAEGRGLLVLELDPRLRRGDMGSAFVVMPYGTKTDRDGSQIDCESAFSKVVVPSLESCDFDWTRADEQIAAGIIHVGMLDRLARSDLVVVDTATENANAFYELGARHVLRPGATVLIGPEGTRPVFNINMLRRVGYRLTGSHVADADAVTAVRRLRPFLEQAGSGTAVPDSPLYQLFDVEPPLVTGWRTESSPAVDLHRRIDSAYGRSDLLAVGDAISRTDLPRVQRTELILRVGVRLRECRAYAEAVQLLRGLEITDSSPVFYGWWCQQLALAERRMGEQIAEQGGDPDAYWEAAERRLLATMRCLGDDPETCGIAGGLAKRRALRILRAESAGHHAGRAGALLDRALHFYGRGFDRQPSDFYTGVNVLTVGRIRTVRGIRPPGRDLDVVAAVTRYYAERSGGDEFWRTATLAELRLDEHYRSPERVSSDDVLDAYAGVLAMPCVEDCIGPIRDQLDLIRLSGADADGTVDLVLSLPELAA